MQMSLGLTLNVIVGFSVVDGRWRGREAILDLDFTISHRCKCQFCQKRFSLRVLALRRVCKQMTIVAMRPCCKTGAKVVLRRSTTLSYFGHVVRAGGVENDVMIWRVSGGRRGRPRQRWLDTLNKLFNGPTNNSMRWDARDRAGWRRAVTAVARGRMRLDGTR